MISRNNGMKKKLEKSLESKIFVHSLIGFWLKQISFYKP